MKVQNLLILLTMLVFGSCSTAYKASQTPDDVYYSPARDVSTVRVEKKRERQEDYSTAEDDRYLRMKVINRDRWATIDDYDYWYDSRYRPYYTYNYYRDLNLWNNWYPGYYPYRSFGFNYYNNPGFGFGYGNNFYPKGYGYGGYGRGNYITKQPYSAPSNVNRPSLRGYNNNNNSFGNTVKRVFSTDNSSYNNNNNSSYNNSDSRTTTSDPSPSRSYNPTSSGSSSSGSSSSGGGVSRPARGGN